MSVFPNASKATAEYSNIHGHRWNCNCVVLCKVVAADWSQVQRIVRPYCMTPREVNIFGNFMLKLHFSDPSSEIYLTAHYRRFKTSECRLVIKCGAS